MVSHHEINVGIGSRLNSGYKNLTGPWLCEMCCKINERTDTLKNCITKQLIAAKHFPHKYLKCNHSGTPVLRPLQYNPYFTASDTSDPMPFLIKSSFYCTGLLYNSFRKLVLIKDIRLHKKDFQNSSSRNNTNNYTLRRGNKIKHKHINKQHKLWDTAMNCFHINILKACSHLRFLQVFM